jgi:hypothetical protein
MREPGPIALSAAIVCLPRSGSHMLASCLASHPLVGSFGEFVGRTQPVPFPTDPVVVGIIMYKHWERALADGVEIARVIHLIRDPHPTALSYLRNQAHRRIEGAAHRAHARQGEPPLRQHPIDLSELDEMTGSMAAQQAEFRRRLQVRDVLEVRYEALTGGRSISVLPADEARRILTWLRLPYARLHTRYVKTGPAA